MKRLGLFVSHLLAMAVGIGLGIYLLPIIVAPPAPTQAEVSAQTGMVRYTGTFRRDLKDSDALHWGEGTVTIGDKAISLSGELAPGPDYKLYLSPEFVETEVDFNRLRPAMVRVGDVKTFRNFVVDLPASVDPSRYNTVVVWCETFSQFITAATYR
jgi:hypothetical protein